MKIAIYNALFTAILKTAHVGRLIAKIARWAFALQIAALVPMFMVSGESLSFSLLTAAPIKGFIIALSVEKLLPSAGEYICKAIAAAARKKQCNRI